MAGRKHILTCVGLKQYEGELRDLKVVKRKEVAREVKEVREQDGLSENAEHDAAKGEQRDIEPRIEELEKLLRNTEVMVEDETDLNRISIGRKVKLLDVEYDEEMEFYIVSSIEASSLQNKISSEFPVGCALIGKVTGDCADVEAQTGDIQCKIPEIQGVS